MTSHAIDRSLHPVVGLHRRVSPGWRLLGSIGDLILAALVGYTAVMGGYAFTIGAAEYLAAAPERVACDTPGTRFGWPYEAVNYDKVDDAILLSYTPDPTFCGWQGAGAGPLVRSADGVPLAGWYIPAAIQPRPEGPTVVLVHGGKSNKSGMLEYAPAFHARYNLLIPDLRNSGRSGGDASTSGVRERADLRAMIDWLVREKHPGWIAVMGNSNGAAAALAEAVEDRRVRALILDSMHATVETQLAKVVTTERHLPAWPAVSAVILGASARIGTDLRSVDPVRMIALMANRPVLLTHGSADAIDPPGESLDLNVAAALGADVKLRVEVCQGASHGRVVAVCESAWVAWVTDFLAANGGLPAAH